jgi:hypothetical protein
MEPMSAITAMRMQFYAACERGDLQKVHLFLRHYPHLLKQKITEAYLQPGKCLEAEPKLRWSDVHDSHCTALHGGIYVAAKGNRRDVIRCVLNHKSGLAADADASRVEFLGVCAGGHLDHLTVMLNDSRTQHLFHAAMCCAILYNQHATLRLLYSHMQKNDQSVVYWSHITMHCSDPATAHVLMDLAAAPISQNLFPIIEHISISVAFVFLERAVSKADWFWSEALQHIASHPEVTSEVLDNIYARLCSEPHTVGDLQLPVQRAMWKAAAAISKHEVLVWAINVLKDLEDQSGQLSDVWVFPSSNVMQHMSRILNHGARSHMFGSSYPPYKQLIECYRSHCTTAAERSLKFVMSTNIVRFVLLPYVCFEENNNRVCQMCNGHTKCNK